MKLKTNKNIKLTPSNNINDDTMYYARWIALYEAINLIADEAETRKKTFDKLKISPVQIKKYITSVEDQIQKKLLQEKLGVDFYLKNPETPNNTFTV